jgi:hypothetical protein
MNGYNVFSQTRTFASLLAIFISASIHPPDSVAQIPLTESISLYGDLRYGYFGQMRNERNGSRIERHEMRLRTRTGLIWHISDRMEARVRYAGRFSSIDPEVQPGWTASEKGNNGLGLGEMAFDEAYLRIGFGSSSHVKLGRFVTGYTLPGVIGNAILRNDAPNNDVQWTDGFMVSTGAGGGWRADLVTQIHYGNWPTNTHRFPLDYGSGSGRVTVFSSITRSRTDELIRLVGFDLSVSPNALFVRPGERNHYVLLSGKVALGWKTDAIGDIIWGIEGAVSPIRPEKQFLRLPGDPGDRVGGAGFQTNLSFMGFVPGHNLGFIVAALQPSFLISEDYWNNTLLAEVRYTWTITRQWSTEIRMRYRGDLYKYTNAERLRGELVPYARLTYRLRS